MGKSSVTGLMNYFLLKITMHNFSRMTLVHHMALKVSHCSKGKGIWFVWVPTRKKYIHNFLRIHKMKWDHTHTKTTTDTTSTASKWGTWTLEWDLEIQKRKTQKRKKETTTFLISRPQTAFSWLATEFS